MSINNSIANVTFLRFFPSVTLSYIYYRKKEDQFEMKEASETEQSMMIVVKASLD